MTLHCISVCVCVCVFYITLGKHFRFTSFLEVVGPMFGFVSLTGNGLSLVDNFCE